MTGGPIWYCMNRWARCSPNCEKGDIMYPTREEAERLLAEGEHCHPGPWGDHSRTVAHCAERIAARCPGMDPDLDTAVERATYRP